MIGREGPVDHFELVRWARHQASAAKLTSREAHVLLLLATYANNDAVAWPSLRTLALAAGLKPTRDGRNSAISAALARLEELALIWTKQGGHGQPARRELLFNPAQPSGRAEGSLVSSAPVHADEPSGSPEGSEGSGPRQPSGPQDAEPSGFQEEKNQQQEPEERPNSKDQRSLPANRKASHPRDRRVLAQDRESRAVREAICLSLASVDRNEVAA